MKNRPALVARCATVGVLTCLAVLSACGGGESSDAALPDTDRVSNDEPEPTTADETGDAVSDEGGVAPNGDKNDGDKNDGDDGDDGAGGDDGDDGGDGRMIDVSDVDWATVDLTTIDWENIDISQLRTDLVEQNPTVANLSQDDLSIIGRRLAESFGSGDVTVTIDDRTYQFQGFECAFESSGVLNEGTVFGSNIFGEVDGVRIQLQIDSYDDGTSDFTMDDIDDFENPSVSYLETTDIVVTIDGNAVHAEGLVVDQTQDTFPEVPMTFDGSCGPGSLR